MKGAQDSLRFSVLLSRMLYASNLGVMLSIQFKHVESHPMARLKAFFCLLFSTPASVAELDHRAPLENCTFFLFFKFGCFNFILSYIHSDLETIQILKMRIKFSKGIALQ